MFLSLCHTIIVDKQKNEYNASSPDELALVNFAKQSGYEYLDKDEQGRVQIKRKYKDTPQKDQIMNYKLLDICEFTSTRKRMSCIYMTPDNQIVLMCKGADSVIEARLTPQSKNSDTF
jgi:phospholipid-transporting ATPase